MLLGVIISIALFGSISTHGGWRREIDCCRNELCPFDCVRCDGKPTCYDLSDELGCIDNKTDAVLQSYPKPQILIPAVLNVVKQHLRKQKESMASTYPYGNCIRPVQHFGPHSAGHRRQGTKDVPVWLALLEKLKAEKATTTTTPIPPIWYRLMQQLRAKSTTTTTTTTTPRPTTAVPTTEKTLLNIFFEWLRLRQQNETTVKPSTSRTNYQIPVPNKSTTPFQIKTIPPAPSPTPKTELVFTSPDSKAIYSRATARTQTPISKSSLSPLGSFSSGKTTSQLKIVTPSPTPKTEIVFTSPDFEAIYSRKTAKTTVPTSKSPSTPLASTFSENDNPYSTLVTDALSLLSTTGSSNVKSTKPAAVDLITGFAVDLNKINTSPILPVTNSQTMSTNMNFNERDTTTKQHHVHSEETNLTTPAIVPDVMSVHTWDTESTTAKMVRSSLGTTYTDKDNTYSIPLTDSVQLMTTTDSLTAESTNSGTVDLATRIGVTLNATYPSPTLPITISQTESTYTKFMETDTTPKQHHVHNEETNLTAPATSPDAVSVHKWDMEPTTETMTQSSTEPLVKVKSDWVSVTQSLPVITTTDSFNMQTSSSRSIDSTTGFVVTPTQSYVSPKLPVTNLTEVKESEKAIHHHHHHHHTHKNNTSLTKTTNATPDAVSTIDNIVDVSTVPIESLSATHSSITIQTEAQSSTPNTVDSTPGSNGLSSPSDLLSTTNAQSMSSNQTITETITERTPVNNSSIESIISPSKNDTQSTVSDFQSSNLAKLLLSTLATVSSGSSQFKNTVPSATTTKFDSSSSTSEGLNKEFKLFINLSDLVKTTNPVRAEDAIAVTPTAASKTITSLFSDPNQSAKPTQLVYSNQPGTTGRKTSMTKLSYDSSPLLTDTKPLHSITNGNDIHKTSPVQIENKQTDVSINAISNFPNTAVKPVQQYVRPAYQPKPDLTASVNSEIRVASKLPIPTPTPVVYQQNQLPMTTPNALWWQPTNSPLNFDSLWGRTTTLSPTTESWWSQTTVPYFWNSFFGIPHTTQRNYLVVNPASSQPVSGGVSVPETPTVPPKPVLPTFQSLTPRYTVPTTTPSSILSTKPSVTTSSYFLNKTPPPIFTPSVWSTASQSVSSQTTNMMTDSTFRSDMMTRTITPSLPPVPTSTQGFPSVQTTTPGFPTVPTTTSGLPSVPTTTPGLPTVPTTTPSLPTVPTTTPSLPMIPTSTPDFPTVPTTTPDFVTVPTTTPGYPTVPTTTPRFSTVPTTTPYFQEFTSTQGIGFPIFSYTARPTTVSDKGKPNGIPIHFENTRNKNVTDMRNGWSNLNETSSQNDFRNEFENLHKNNVTSFLAKLRELYSQIVSTQQNIGTDITQIDGSTTTAMENNKRPGYAINTTLFDSGLDTTTQKFVKPYEPTTNQQRKETKPSWWLSSATTTAFNPKMSTRRTRRTSTIAGTSFPSTNRNTMVPSTAITTNFNTVANSSPDIPIRNRLGVSHSPIYPTVSGVKNFQFDPDQYMGKRESAQQEYVRHGTSTLGMFTPVYNITKPVLAEWTDTSGTKATRLLSTPNYGRWSEIISAVTEASLGNTKHHAVGKDLQTVTYNLFQSGTSSLPSRNSDTNSYRGSAPGKVYSQTTPPYYDFTVTPPTTTPASSVEGRNCQLIRDGGEFCGNRFPGYYKNAADCRTFFVCDWKNGFLCHCPPNLLFDDTINVCNWDYNVQC